MNREGAPSPGRLPERRIGTTDLEIPILGFGGAPLGDLYTRIDEATAIDTVTAAIGQGIRLLDTSPLYGNGLSEHRIGAAMRRTDSSGVVLSTKVGRVADPFHPPEDRGIYVGGLPHSVRYDYSYDGALRSIEQSLLRLGRDRIEIALVHDLDGWTHGDELEARYREAGEGCVRALRRLREEGVIGAFGLGVNESPIAHRFCRDFQPDVVLLAGRYSLLEQPALADLLPYASEKGIGIILGGVFNSGILATGAVEGARYNYSEPPADVLERVRRLESVCDDHGVPLRRAALQFVFGHDAVSAVVLGAVSPEEVESQVADFAEPVPAALWERMRTEGLLAPDTPVPAS